MQKRGTLSVQNRYKKGTPKRYSKTQNRLVRLYERYTWHTRADAVWRYSRGACLNERYTIGTEKVHLRYT